MNVNERLSFIHAIKTAPGLLRKAVDGLSDDQLNTPYREGGWNPRQVVHHLADSHTHAYIRIKFMLTENHPELHPYDQDAWAELQDAKSGKIGGSLAIFDGIHERLANLFDSLSEDEFNRTAHHPERGIVTVGDYLELYARHGMNHINQITDLRRRMGW